MNASGGASLVAITRHALAEREGAMFFQEISKKNDWICTENLQKTLAKSLIWALPETAKISRQRAFSAV